MDDFGILTASDPSLFAYPDFLIKAILFAAIITAAVWVVEKISRKEEDDE